MNPFTKEEEMLLLDGPSIFAECPKPFKEHDRAVLAEIPSIEQRLQVDAQAYATRLERRVKELETEVNALRPNKTNKEKISAVLSATECLRSSNEKIEELEAKLENSIELSPGNAKLIIQFLAKPIEGKDWEVDATIDLLWKELERQAAKA